MEGPMNSSADKNNINIDVLKDDDDDDDHALSNEESGWTAYLEDFSNGSLISSPSLVSDAAWYGSNNNVSPVKRLNFKNLKRSSNRKKYTCDDDLEDTASSPVNSPKVSTLKQMEMNNNQRTDDVAAGNSLGKQAGSISFSEQIEIHDEKNERNVDIGSRNIDEQYVDLRKRGLCVVPMSALINYFG